MKKILIAILLIVPLLIIFTLNTSASIVSAQIEIGVERMVLTHQGEVVSGEMIRIDLDDYIKSNKKYTLFVEFTPTYVTNKEVEWRSTDSNVAKVKKQGSGAVVSFVSGHYGSVEIIATAVSNTSISASVTFFVTGSQLGRVELFDFADASEARLNHLSLVIGEKKQIGARTIPSEAFTGSTITWESSNKDVVTVDENGTITAVGKGSANVRAICKKGAERVSSSFDVAVSEEGLYTTDAVYTTDGTVALSSFAASPQVQVTGVEGAVFNGDSFTLTEEEAWVTVAYNGIEDRILLQRVANKELLLENAASYKKGVWAKEGFVTLGTSHFAVNVISNLGAERLDVQWSSSAPSVARVENGRIVGVSYGRAVLTASKEGYADLTIPVFVVEKMGDINLKFDALNDKAGLAERRVFGVYTCDKNLQVTDHLHLDIATTYPTHLKDYAEFDNLVEYIVDDPTLASVDENGFISFSRAAIGKTVTVTVKSLYSDNKAKDSYTFHIVDGINVGVGVEAYYDKTVSTEYPDFDPYNEFRYVMETYVGDYEDNGVLGCVVCQSNVYLPPEKAPYWKWDDEVRLNRPIEGNGFVLDGQLHCDEYDDHLFRSGLDCSRLIEMCGEDYELVVNNLFIQSYAPISDDSEEAFKDLKVRGGTSYRMDSANTSLKNLEVTFRFCNFRYAYIHLNPASGVINLDGCIFSNSAGPAIMHYGGRDDSTEVVVNNCIFSNTISPVYLSTRGNIGLEKTDDNIYKYTILRLTGENYIYNWKLIDEVQMDIFPSVDDDKMLNSLIAALNQQVTGYLKEVLSDSSNKQYVYKQIKGDYVNFACVTLGIWADHQMKINPTDPTVLEEMGEKRSTMFFDENKWYAGELDMSKMQDIIFSKKLYKAALTAMGVDLVNKKSYLVIPRNKDGKYNTQPDETYHIDEKTKKRLRGEG